MSSTTGAPLGRTTSTLGQSQTLWTPAYIEVKKCKCKSYMETLKKEKMEMEKESKKLCFIL